MAFIPRTVFPTLDSLPRSYFLGHHRAGLRKMQSLLSSIDLVLECRDARVPVTSRNPLFEEALAGRPRLVIYTKRDLMSDGAHPAADALREATLSAWHAPTPVLFTTHSSRPSLHRVLSFARNHAASAASHLTGTRLLVVGMPNVGKSCLLNALRTLGTGNSTKAARTGAQPGITRSVSTHVKILPASSSSDDEEEGNAPYAHTQQPHGAVYLLDTPGVFVPYVPDAHSMLKLALCGCVKDSIIPAETLADYLLYHINRTPPQAGGGPAHYATYHRPTNDVGQLLDAVARKTGRLQKGGVPDTEAAAQWFVQRWRAGKLGRFVLDEVPLDNTVGAGAHVAPWAGEAEGGRQVSMSQAVKADKEARRIKAKARARDAG